MTRREQAARYEASLGRDTRRATGAFYTPDALIDRVLDLSLEPLLDELESRSGSGDEARRRLLEVRILDPSCGAGLFLAAAADRIARRAGVPPQAAYPCLMGVDLDPGAIEVAGRLLPGADLRVDNGLLGEFGPVDAVVGNPPFLSQLRTATAMSREDVAGVRALLGDVATAYTDVSALFLVRSFQLLRPGGRLGLVQPLSLLAARDAAGVRAYVETHSDRFDLWASSEPQFADASVLTCVVSARAGRGEPSGAPTWGPLAAPVFGIPPVGLGPGGGALGELGAVTADFRDQYYGLREHLGEGGEGFPLVTTGLIGLGRCEWGERAARIHKQRWQRPTVRPGVLDGPLGEWARKRLVPKVLIGTQGRIIEAVVDSEGAWLPGVPVITMTTTRPWHALAVLCSPPVVAHAAATYLGTGLSPHSIKLSAKQAAGLPLPTDAMLWDRAAAQAKGGDMPGCAATMTRAYGCDERVLDWWLGRAGLS